MSIRIWSILGLLVMVNMILANDSWLKDTIYIQLDENSNRFVIHKVEKKQTLFSLANAYGIDLYDVYDHNPILKSRILMADDQLRMPISEHNIILDESLLDKSKKYRPVIYITKPKDNLYKVAKQYFKMSFDQLMIRNHLTVPTIKVNQKLVIGWFDNSKKAENVTETKPNTLKSEQANLEEKFTTANPAPFTEEYKAIDLVASEWVKKYSKEENNSDYLINLNKNIPEIKLVERKAEKAISSIKPAEESKPVEVSKKSEKISLGSIDNPNVSLEKPRVLKRKMITQSGVARWVKTENTNGDLYCLHPTAPVNSVVEITNPMTHRKIYAKVLSNMPAKLYGDDINVVVSPGVANLLGVIDSRFYVKLRYVEETIQ